MPEHIAETLELADDSDRWLARRVKWLAAALLGVVALIGATTGVLLLSGTRDSGSTHGPVAAGAPRHADPGPLDLATVPRETRAHFEFAVAHTGAFRQITCWCGCEKFLAHRNLADCFWRRDGTGYERHAAGCGVCIAEAAVAERMLAEGRTPDAIDSAVDESFGPTTVTTPTT